MHAIVCRKDDLEVGLTLYSQAKNDGITPNIVMSRCVIGKLTNILAPIFPHQLSLHCPLNINEHICCFSFQLDFHALGHLKLFFLFRFCVLL